MAGADITALMAAAQNLVTLQASLMTAVNTTNPTFIGLTVPTTTLTAAQSIQLWNQVRALSQQVDAIIRVVLPSLSSTAGT